MKRFDRSDLLYAVLGSLLLSTINIMYGATEHTIGNLAIYAFAGAFFGIGVREIQNRLTG